MSTSTARLQLTKPAGSDSMALGATQLSDAWSKIDAAVGVKKFATQGAATGVFNGDLILETSTNQSKIFSSPNWINIYDPNNGQGNAQTSNTGPVAVHTGLTEILAFDWVVSVVVGRKYLVNLNLGLTSLQLFNINGTTNYQGFCRLDFKWTTDINAVPSTLFHDITSYISGMNDSQSKGFKSQFEFFPNVTQQVKIGMFMVVLTGDEGLELNIANSTPNIYLQDWGI